MSAHGKNSISAINIKQRRLKKIKTILGIHGQAFAISYFKGMSHYYIFKELFPLMLIGVHATRTYIGVGRAFFEHRQLFSLMIIGA